MSRSRRKKDQSLLLAILAAPWTVSAWVGAIVFVVFQWFLPAITAQSVVMTAFVQGLKPLGLLAALFFGLVALVKFVQQQGRTTERPQSYWTQDHNKQLTFLQRTPEPDRVFHEWETSTKRSPPVAPRPTEWSIGLLRLIEWKRFEELAVAFYQEIGLRTKSIHHGADGGIDAKLYRDDATEPTAIVQCKAWNSRPVGVKPVRELLGVMTHEKVPEGIFMTTGTFSDDAIACARTNPIELVNGDTFLGMIRNLSSEAQTRLLEVATEGDYTTPTCASCGVKLVRRESKRGAFWGCTNFPRCNIKINLKADVA